MKKKITLAVLLNLIFGLSINAQAPSWGWAKTAGGVQEDNGKSIVTDASGNVYATGFFRSPTITFGTTTLTNADISGNTDDVFIVKYNSAGILQWALSEGGMGNDEGSGISTDVMGNVYVTGNFTSSTLNIGFVTLSNADSVSQHYDIFLAKFSNSGNVIWAKSYGGNSDDNSNGINTDIGGSTYITGTYSSDTIKFDTTVFVDMGNLDIFVTKINSFGDVVWARNAWGSAEDKSAAVTTDSMGNVGITGYFFSNTINFDGTTLFKMDTSGNDTIGFTNDLFVAKYNSIGDLLWVRSAGGIGGYYDEVSSNGIAMNKKGETYITGYFRYDTLHFDLGNNLINNNTSRDFFLAKYDTVGNVSWSLSAGDYLDDEGRGIVVDNHGDVLVTGYYDNGNITFGTTTLTTTGFDSEVFVVKYDSLGSAYWAVTAGGVNGDFGNSVATFGTNNIYVTGQYYSPNASFDSFNINDAGLADIFIARIYPVTSVGIVDSKEKNKGLMVYPNPSVDFSIISYSLNKASSIELNIYNELGEVVASIVKDEVQAQGNYQYVFSAAESGIYFVKLQTSDGVMVQRLAYTK
jgi:Secretion system C-terminal sorting domain